MQFIQDRIAHTKELIVAYEDALLTFAQDGAISSYTLNTSQSVQTVSRAQIASIRLLLDGLYNRCATLESRVSGSATHIAGPAW